MKQMKNLVHQITQSKGILVLTGAGVSVASGIAPFRGTDPEAVWNKDVTEKGTYAYFRSDVLGSWSWYLDRFSTLFGKQPNLAHHALVDMEEWCAKHHLNFTLLTQNIDGLHRDAGSQALFEVHGTVRRLRCGTTGCRYGEPHGSIPFPTNLIAQFREHPKTESIPQCVECGDFLRPHVLWFDEYYTAHSDYRYHELPEQLSLVDMILCIGTSFSVGITSSILEFAFHNGFPVWVVDPCHPDIPNINWLKGRAEVLLPELMVRLCASSTQ